MITIFLLVVTFLIVGAALLVYSKSRGKGKAAKPVQRSRESIPAVGRADGSGDD